jgi:hypothetical protein
VAEKGGSFDGGDWGDVVDLPWLGGCGGYVLSLAMMARIRSVGVAIMAPTYVQIYENIYLLTTLLASQPTCLHFLPWKITILIPIPILIFMNK